MLPLDEYSLDLLGCNEKDFPAWNQVQRIAPCLKGRKGKKRGRKRRRKKKQMNQKRKRNMKKRTKETREEATRIMVLYVAGADVMESKLLWREGCFWILRNRILLPAEFSDEKEWRPRPQGAVRPALLFRTIGKLYNSCSYACRVVWECWER
jgi:hypothetical protein